MPVWFCRKPRPASPTTTNLYLFNILTCLWPDTIIFKSFHHHLIKVLFQVGDCGVHWLYLLLSNLFGGRFDSECLNKLLMQKIGSTFINMSIGADDCVQTRIKKVMTEAAFHHTMRTDFGSSEGYSLEMLCLIYS